MRVRPVLVDQVIVASVLAVIAASALVIWLVVNDGDRILGVPLFVVGLAISIYKRSYSDYDESVLDSAEQSSGDDLERARFHLRDILPIAISLALVLGAWLIYSPIVPLIAGVVGGQAAVESVLASKFATWQRKNDSTLWGEKHRDDPLHQRGAFRRLFRS